MTRLGFPLAVVAVLAGCTPAHEARTDATSPEAQTTMSRDTLAVRRLPQELQGAFRYNSGLDTPTRETVRDAEAWHRLWTGLTARVRSPLLPLPEVDFAREMVLVAAMGQRPTGGYNLHIESARADGNELVALVVETSPGPRCGVTSSLTAPADAVVVTRSTLPVRWTVRQAVNDCP